MNTRAQARNVREMLSEALIEAVRAAGYSGDLPDLELGRAKATGRGEYASSAAMKLTRLMNEPPPQIATALAERIAIPGDAATVEVERGYLNFRLTPTWLQRLVEHVAATGPGYGAADLGQGERLQVEFASINPTGPLHIGHGPGPIEAAIQPRFEVAARHGQTVI